jgi:hypothetical protein
MKNFEKISEFIGLALAIIVVTFALIYGIWSISKINEYKYQDMAYEQQVQEI